MLPIDKLILNALADWKNLKQLYLALSYDSLDGQLLRAVPGGPSLEEIAGRLLRLVKTGYVFVSSGGKTLVGGHGKRSHTEDVCVWCDLFQTTPEGRSVSQTAHLAIASQAK